MSHSLVTAAPAENRALTIVATDNSPIAARSSDPIPAADNPTTATNSHLTIDEAFRILAADERELEEHDVSCADIQVDNDVLCFGPHRVNLSADGIRRVCGAVGAPAEYLLRFESDFRSHILQYQFERGHSPARMAVISRRGDLVGLTRADLFRLRATEALEAVCDVVGTTELVVHKLRRTGEFVQVELVNPAVPETIAPGDVMLSGLQLSHSLLGLEATTVQAFILRLKCANGMTHRQCISGRISRTRRLPASHPEARQCQMRQIRQLAEDCLRALQGKLSAIRGLQSDEVEIEGLFRTWLERARISVTTLLPLLLNAWKVEGGRPTAYDAMNALTRVATHDATIGIRQQRVLAGLAGILAFRKIHICPRCFAVLSRRDGAETHDRTPSAV